MQNYDKFMETPTQRARTLVQNVAPQNPFPHLLTARLRSRENTPKKKEGMEGLAVRERNRPSTEAIPMPPSRNCDVMIISSSPLLAEVTVTHVHTKATRHVFQPVWIRFFILTFSLEVILQIIYLYTSMFADVAKTVMS